MLANQAYPVSVAAMACRYGEMKTLNQVWQFLNRDQGRVPFSLAASTASYSQFAVPPIYRQSINKAQLLAFELADEVLQLAGLEQGHFDRDKTDVILCTGFGMDRAYANFNRLFAKQVIDDLKLGHSAHGFSAVHFDAVYEDWSQAYGASSHDKVGEMACTIPARIANFFKLKGRTFALESTDGVGAHALEFAIDALTQGDSEAVLVISIQHLESALMGQVLAQHSIQSQTLCEGATAFLLTRITNKNCQSMGCIHTVQFEVEQCQVESADCVDGTQFVEGSSEPGCYYDAMAFFGQQYANRVGSALLFQLLCLMHKTLPLCLSNRLNNQKIVFDQWAIQGKTVNDQFFTIRTGQYHDRDLLCERDLVPIAVNHIGAVFGQANTLDEYWTLLNDDKGSIQSLLNDSVIHPSFFDSVQGKNNHHYCQQASFVLPKSSATNQYAPVSPKQLIDRVCSNLKPLEALGKTLSLVATNLTGFEEKQAVFSICFNQLRSKIEHACVSAQLSETVYSQVKAVLDLWAKQLSELPRLDQVSASYLAQSVSSQLGVKAVSVALEGACAASMAMTDLAMNALRSGRYDRVIVTAVEVPVNVNDLCLCSAQRMLAPDRIATFTENALGFTPGDGAGVMVLTRHDHAMQKGLPIHALLYSMGASTDSKSVISPNQSGQIRAMQRALNDAPCEPKQVLFIETHGTGTEIGDQVEIESISQVYSQSERQNPIYLGALKTRFGHAFAASGMASMIKVCLMIQKKQLPCNLFFAKLRESLALEERKLNVLEATEVIEDAFFESSFFGVNAFGTGGVNYHLIMGPNPKTLNFRHF